MGICNRVAISVLLIASHDRPFSGEISKPDVLLQWQKAGSHHTEPDIYLREITRAK
jgi:hypothetical protein